MTIWLKECPYNPYTEEGNIFCSAWILSKYLRQSHGRYVEALACYKGYSDLGFQQARRVLEIRKQMEIK